MTRKGTLKSTTNPWNIAIITYSLPENRVITGKVVSIVVAPPEQIGANFPKQRTRTAAPNKAMISRIILVVKAIVPNSAPLYSVIKILDKE